MDAEAALEQLRALHQRKTQQIEHVKTLTAEFRQWRGDFTSQLGAQRADYHQLLEAAQPPPVLRQRLRLGLRVVVPDETERWRDAGEVGRGAGGGANGPASGCGRQHHSPRRSLMA